MPSCSSSPSSQASVRAAAEGDDGNSIAGPSFPNDWIFFPNSRALLPTFRANCPDGSHFAQMGSHSAQNTIPNPCPFFQPSHAPFMDMYVHKTPPSPPQNTLFPGLNLKVGKMKLNCSLGNLDPNGAKCLKIGQNHSKMCKKSIQNQLIVIKYIRLYVFEYCSDKVKIKYSW